MRWYRAGVIPCDILVPHIDSRVKIIENERPEASPCGSCDTKTVKETSLLGVWICSRFLA